MAFFRTILEEFDGSSDLAQAQREALETLEALAEAKRELFNKQINLLILDAGTGSNKTVPISIVQKSDGMSRAFSSTSAKDIGDILKKAIGGFVEGGSDNIINGIIDILTRTLEVFLGSSAGVGTTKVEYFVYATDFSIYRVDLMAWARSVTATSLRTKIEQATAYEYCISIVDVDKISWSDFVGLFSLQLDNIKSMTPTERNEARTRMKETWDFLKGPSGEDLALLAADGSLIDAPSNAQLEREYRIPLMDYN